MSRLHAFGAFLYDFAIGDDPLLAAIVVAALGLTAALASAGIAAWWVMPPAVIGALALSGVRASRRAAPEVRGRDDDGRPEARTRVI
jgi:hypothetical protein